VPLKSPKGVDWSGPLRTYVQNNYLPEELDKHASSIQRLSTTRERVGNFTSPQEVTTESLESYLRMLGQVEPRFPLGEGGLKMSFTWNDALKPSKDLSMSQIAFERGCVLYNLAAVLSMQGMVQDRSDATGLKKACGFFQRAAGLFKHVQSMMGTEIMGPTTSDMSLEGLSMAENLMLAQAQACFYEKAIGDNHKAAILSKLASKAYEWYKAAYDQTQQPTLSATLDPAWPAHLQFQCECFSASAQYQYSKVIHQQAEETTVGYGEEIARLQAASHACEVALYVAKKNKLPEQMLQTVVNLQGVITTRLNEAVTDNNKIYMQIIPSSEGLSMPPATALAKPTVPDDDIIKISTVSNSGEDAIFQGLLPVAMQEAEILYQSKLSLIVETNGKKVQDSSEQVKLRLAEAGLPAAVEAGDGTSNGVPDAVWCRISNNVQGRGGVDGLQRGMQANESLAVQIEQGLSSIRDILDKEESEDTRARGQWGTSWATTRSGELSLHMRGDITRYSTLLQEARASDSVLKDKLRSNLSLMEILTYPKHRLDATFPNSDDVNNNPDVEATRVDLSLMLVELGSNIQQVEGLQHRLVDTVSKDSIANAMAAAPGGPKAIAADEHALQNLISREAAKYSSIEQQIDALVRSQPTLLQNVLTKNQKFAMMRNSSEGMRKREALIGDIDKAIKSFEEIAMFIAEGEKFYHSLKGRIDQLATTAQDHCYVRNIQRNELENELRSRPPPSAMAPTPGVPAPAYPGMRPTSQPLMTPYAAGGAAQAFPVTAAVSTVPVVATGYTAAPAYPVNNTPPPAPPRNLPPPPLPQRNNAGPPPPQYASVQNPGNENKLAMMRGTLGNSYSDAQLNQALDGAGGDVNIAINHLLGA